MINLDILVQKEEGLMLWKNFVLFFFLGFFLQHAKVTLLHFGLPTLEEVEGICGFGVYMFHHRENVQDVLFCEGRLMTAVEVILLYQNLKVK